jgi:hypothetical protein
MDLGALFLVPQILWAFVEGDFPQWSIIFGKFQSEINLNLPKTYKIFTWLELHIYLNVAKIPYIVEIESSSGLT